MFFSERVYWGARGAIDRLFSAKSKAFPSDTAAAAKAASGSPEGQPTTAPQSSADVKKEAAPAQTPAGSAVNPLVQRLPVTAS